MPYDHKLSIEKVKFIKYPTIVYRQLRGHYLFYILFSQINTHSNINMRKDILYMYVYVYIYKMNI